MRAQTTLGVDRGPLAHGPGPSHDAAPMPPEAPDALEEVSHAADKVRAVAFIVFQQRIKSAQAPESVRKALRGLMLTLKAIDVAMDFTSREPAALSASMVHEALTVVATRGLDQRTLEDDLNAVAEAMHAHLL
jgi:hypothetical protein